jgi:opacity protein-like surface antigen
MRVLKTILLGVMALGVMAASSQAEEKKGNFFVGAGYVKPADVDNGTAYFTGGLQFKVGATVAVEAEGGYWEKTEGIEDFYSTNLSDVTIGMNLVFRPNMEGPFGVYLGVGPAVHLVKLDISFVGITASETKTLFGGSAFLGADFKVSQPVSVFATARYDVAGKSNWGEELRELNISGFKAYAGLRIHF